MPLKKTSRNVVFVPIDPDSHRLSLPLAMLQQVDEDTNNIWMPNIIDKY